MKQKKEKDVTENFINNGKHFCNASSNGRIQNVKYQLNESDSVPITFKISMYATRPLWLFLNNCELEYPKVIGWSISTESDIV